MRTDQQEEVLLEVALSIEEPQFCFMAEVIGECEKYGIHETATSTKHSFEANLLKLDKAARQRVAGQLDEMSLDPELSSKLN